MDPNQTYRDLLAAMTAGDFDQALIHAETLEQWIKHGGFAPRMEHSYYNHNPVPRKRFQALSRAFEAVSNLGCHGNRSVAASEASAAVKALGAWSLSD